MQSSHLCNFISLCGKVAYLVDEWRRVDVGLGGLGKLLVLSFCTKCPVHSGQVPNTMGTRLADGSGSEL